MTAGIASTDTNMMHMVQHSDLRAHTDHCAKGRRSLLPKRVAFRTHYHQQVKKNLPLISGSNLAYQFEKYRLLLDLASNPALLKTGLLVLLPALNFFAQWETEVGAPGNWPHF